MSGTGKRQDGRRRTTAGRVAGRAVLGLVLGYASMTAAGAPQAENVILMIGDGMGPGQVEAGRCYKGTNLVFETWAAQGQMRTFSANSTVTDSAASATALATGHKVNNGVLSMALPGDGREYETVLEYLGRKGRRTGLVTTTTITHATPAAFGAHEGSRGSTSAIALDLLAGSRPNVLFGGGGDGMTASAAVAAGYTVVTNRAGMQAVATTDTARVSGQFGVGYLPYETVGLGALPHLREMTAAALDILEDGPNGFFLMVEGGRIDHACHANNITNCVGEMMEFERAVQVALDWIGSRSNTLLIVTADHETGGLHVTTNRGPGVVPGVSWTTTGHTDANVGLYAIGPGSGMVTGVVDNTDVYRAMMRTQPVTTEAYTIGTAGTGGVETVWNAPIGDLCRLEATDSLIVTNWVTVATVTASTHVVTLIDTNAPAGTTRYYRLISSP